MEEFRRQDDLGILVQASGEVYRQTAGAGDDSRRTGRGVAGDVSRTQQLSAERTGYRADLSECTRVDRVRQVFFAAGQWVQARGHYKDVNALFDWIATQPELDANRIAVTGGSYGGHMTLAVSTFYSDRIRCSVDIVGMSNLVTFLEHTEA